MPQQCRTFNLLVPEVRESGIRQASDYLGISSDTLYKYGSEGFGPPVKLGNRGAFKRSRLDEWMDQQSDQHAAGSIRATKPVSPSVLTIWTPRFRTSSITPGWRPVAGDPGYPAKMNRVTSVFFMRADNL